MIGDGVEQLKSLRFKVYGQEIPVHASIHTMGGFSAHADQEGLMNWFGTIAPSKPRLIITHGENRARDVLSSRIAAKHKVKAQCPELGDVIEI